MTNSEARQCTDCRATFWVTQLRRLSHGWYCIDCVKRYR